MCVARHAATATTLQQHCNTSSDHVRRSTRCNSTATTLQHHCNTSSNHVRRSTHCNSTATSLQQLCNTLQHIGRSCASLDTLQQHCNSTATALQHIERSCASLDALQQHCNNTATTLQHVATCRESDIDLQAQVARYEIELQCVAVLLQCCKHRWDGMRSSQHLCRSTHCNTLQQHCNNTASTLQQCCNYASTRCNMQTTSHGGASTEGKLWNSIIMCVALQRDPDINMCRNTCCEIWCSVL